MKSICNILNKTATLEDIVDLTTILCSAQDNLMPLYNTLVTFEEFIEPQESFLITQSVPPEGFYLGFDISTAIKAVEYQKSIGFDTYILVCESDTLHYPTVNLDRLIQLVLDYNIDYKRQTLMQMKQCNYKIVNLNQQSLTSPKFLVLTK